VKANNADLRKARKKIRPSAAPKEAMAEEEKE
jgi:hypothetical protein